MKDYHNIKQNILDMQDMMMTAYDKGYADGIMQGRKEKMSGEYKRGLDDAWKCAYEVSNMSSAELARTFGAVYATRVFGGMTADRVKAILNK